jgi:hypothetical protein
MRRIFASALIWLLISGTAEAVFYGNDVHSWCQFNRSMALAYAAALVDQSARIEFTLDVTVRPPQAPPESFINGALNMAKKLLVGFCLPDQATMEQVTDVLCSYLKDTPQDRHLQATFLFQKAMQKAWPCS